jgi:hypothetical protein
MFAIVDSSEKPEKKEQKRDAAENQDVYVIDGAGVATKHDGKLYEM